MAVKTIKGVGNVTEDKGGMTVGTKSGSYNANTGTYSIKDLATGKTTTGSGTQADYDKAYSSYGGGSSGGGGGSSSRSASPYQDQLNALKRAQLKASTAALDKQRNSSLSNLTAERAVIEPTYQKEKMQAGVTAKQTARSFDEYMAQRGGNRSGIAGQGQLLNNMAYQRQYGELGQAEASELSDNARRVTDVNNAYESDLVGAEAGIQAQYLQNYLQQMNLDRQYNQSESQFNANLGLQQAGLTGMYNGEQTLQARTAEQDQAYRIESLQLQKEAQTWQQQFQEKGFTADEAYRAAQMKFQQEQAALDEKYRYATLAKSGSSGGGGSRSSSKSSSGSSGGYSTYEKLSNANSATRTMAEQLAAALGSGATVPELNNDIDEMVKNGTAAAKKYDVQLLKNMTNSVPMDNWQYLPR